MDNKAPGKDVSEQDLLDKFTLAAKKSSDHITKFEVDGIEFGGDLIPIMAGPNTVESRDQILRTAESVKNSGAHILRGGAFKPLTFPYRSDTYYELREEGLRYLEDAKREVGIPIITEVMDTAKVAEVAEVADILQIGTRNMQNFPLITAAAKTGKPVMIKRHFGCSLRDWLGAVEYVLVENNSKVILCERGVSVPHTHRSSSRFLLDLQVIPAAKEVTHLPIASDPSHATFWAPWVEPMALASIAAGADSIMLEVHPDPKNAAVDPLQAISFDAFDKLMKKMKAVADSVSRTLV
jgi:3-deoxy-7-phosphoheptulonate synthase